jgi:hypothetical protein
MKKGSNLCLVPTTVTITETVDANLVQDAYNNTISDASPFQPPARHFGNFPGKSTLIFSGVDQNEAQYCLNPNP